MLCVVVYTCSVARALHYAWLRVFHYARTPIAHKRGESFTHEDT